MALAEIESGMVATLRSVLGTRVKEVIDLPDEWSDDFLKQLLLSAPCAGIGFAGASPLNVGAVPAIFRTGWVVMACANHAANATAQRRGDARAIGAYQILEAAIGALNGADIAGVTTLQAVRIENLFSRKTQQSGVTVLAAHFRADVRMGPDAAGYGALSPFETFHADIDMAPADGRVDAQADVQLEQT